MKRIILLLVVVISVILPTQAQNEKELIELHKKNLRHLYQSRGAAPEWVTTGKVDEQYVLSSCMDHYAKKTALLIYSYQKDSLTINLFDQERKKLRVSHLISKEALINDINNTNMYFSQSGGQKTPKLRGSNPISIPKATLKVSFDKINQLLLPKSFELNSYEHIILVPVFNISTLPFAAFRIEDSTLIDLMSYSIAPSLFELMVSKEVNAYADVDVIYNWENALFVGNPKYPNDTNWQFPDLPGAVNEIDAITENLNKDNYLKLTGTDATKTNIIKSICEYDLLYFATHGISDAENPLENSFLVLAESKESSSYFTLSEIMNIRKDCMLKADLVVLSACQTGLGKSHEGGIIGLARSFQIAGANHVLMSLWNIDDSQTAILMKLFFDELSKAHELMPHEALRQAILKYKNTVNSDPKYWAAFSIFGVPY